MAKFMIYSVDRSALQNEEYDNYGDIACESNGHMGCDSPVQLLLMFLEWVNTEEVDDSQVFFLADEEEKKLIKME